jgi:hypothetical protein
MESGGGLIEDVERASGIALRQLGRELDALRFTAGERRCALAKVDVTKTDVIESVKLLVDARLILEESERILDGEIENVGD